MVAAMKETLTGAGVNEDDIRSEDSLAIENAHQGSSKST